MVRQPQADVATREQGDVAGGEVHVQRLGQRDYQQPLACGTYVSKLVGYYQPLATATCYLLLTPCQRVQPHVDGDPPTSATAAAVVAEVEGGHRPPRTAGGQGQRREERHLRRLEGRHRR